MESNYIIKNNALIEAHYRLSAQEQKLILSVVSMINPEDNDFHEYRLSIRDFVRIMDVSGGGYNSIIKQSVKKFLKKPIVIHRNQGDELHCNWFSSVEYIKDGYLSILIDPKLKPYLLGLKSCFTIFQLRNILRIKSGYAIRIYELLRQYLKIHRRVIMLDDLRLKLGISLHEYKNFGDFKRFVLNRAQKELKEKTDIKFIWEPIKTGRKITAIKFYVSENKALKDTPEKKH